MPFKAAFFNVPGHGHVDPSLPLVRELVRRGHTIDYFVTPAYRAKVEAAGAVYRPTPGIEDDYFTSRGLDGSRPMLAAYSLIEAAGRILPDVLSELELIQPDVILFDGMCTWGNLAAQILKLPSAASCSLMAPIRPPLKALLQPDLLRLMFSVLTKNTRAGLSAGRLARELGRKYQVKGVGLESILNSQGDMTLVYTSPEFEAFSRYAQASLRFVGREAPEHPGALPQGFDRLNGRPLIYASLGTIINRNPAFFRAIIAAFARREEAVLISTGNGVDPAEFGELPDNVSVEAWVPQSEVLKRAALFICHGGLNSVHDGFLFGVPMLLVPQQEEQTLNARRAVELGAGLMLRRGQLDVENLRAHAGRLLAEPGYRAAARRMGDTLRAPGGARRAADEIEAFLSHGKEAG